MIDELYPCETIKGIFGISLYDNMICKIIFPGFWDEKCSVSRSIPIIDELKEDLNNYFSGQIINWTVKYNLYTENASIFRQKVWSALKEIPYGKTLSYFELAQKLNVKCYRAVGSACHYNNIPILIPCHRVVNKNGNLGGFGPGLSWKRFLLDIEKRN